MVVRSDQRRSSRGWGINPTKQRGAQALRVAVAAALCLGAIAMAGPEASHAAACGKPIAGDRGADRIKGNGSGNRIRGRGGNDRLHGRGGRDCVGGGGGRDRIKGGAGRDKLRGGGGADRIKARDGTRDLVVCGRGRDRARVDRHDVVRGCEGPKKPPPTHEPGSYVPESQLGPIPAAAHYLSPAGSDANPGTAVSPWRTIAHAIAASGPGDTVVLMAGTYGARGTTHDFGKAGTSGAAITFRGNPAGSMPRILGHVRLSADYVRLNYLLFDGPTGTAKAPTPDNPRGEQVQISIIGSSVDGVEISDSEIRNSHWHAGIYASTANNVRITGNYIHDNGNFADPSQANQSHGIYFAQGSGLIANNVITHNVARGIQLYGSPHDVVIANNTVARNGKAGIQFATGTANCVAINNLVAYNAEYGIRSDNLSGSNNVVRQNLAWGNDHDLAPADGLTLIGNLHAHPGFGPFEDYRPPAGSPAIDRAHGSYAPGRDFDAVPRPRGAGPDVGAFETG